MYPRIKYDCTHSVDESRIQKRPTPSHPEYLYLTEVSADRFRVQQPFCEV